MDYNKNQQKMIKFSWCCIAICLFITDMTSAFGYDAGSSTACKTKSSRKGRARLLATIPCDLTTQVYCNLPGTSYPWNAVRRFVHENQGLMKRMYGDVKHISVLRTEIENNDIEVDDIERAAARYSRSGWRKPKYLYQDYETSKTQNDILVDGFDFRPMTTVAAATEATTQSSSSSVGVTDDTTIGTSSTTSAPLSMVSVNTTTSKSTTNLSFDEKELERLTDELIVSELIQSSLETNSITETRLNDTINGDMIDIIGNETIKLNDNQRSTVTPITTTTTTTEKLSVTLQNTANIVKTTLKATNSNLNFNVLPKHNGNVDASDEDFLDAIDTQPMIDTDQESAVIVEEKQNRPGGNMEGQLYQDMVQKDPPPTAKGVNACPVKEEVVAPFWANNTRGEVLALLNLYPFEQYVHWEKCTHENKQMYCRDGCRCEQQYRLHRLLAYDPHNECRGIFSDWFRFPSCCICRCYNIPLEFRVTSRSPRSSEQKSPLDEAQEKVKSAIYQHATEEWYRPNNEWDDGE